jgi:HK97 family phage portal protein
MGIANWLGLNKKPTEERSVGYDRILDLIRGGVVDYAAGVNEDTALAISAVYAAVDRISNSLASIPCNVYERTSEGKRVATNHDQYFLWHSEPSDILTSFQLRKALFAWCLLRGNGYARINRTGGRPSAYEFVHPKDVIDIVEVEGELFYIIAGEAVSASDMVHISTLSKNGYFGLSPIQIHAQAIGAALKRNIHSNKAMENGSTLSGVLKYPHGLKPEQKEALRESWRARHGGVDNSGSVPILEYGVEFQALSMTPADIQLIEVLKFTVEDIARIYGIPPHMIGHLERSTNNNINQQSVEYVQYCLTPWAVQFEQELNRKIFRPNEKKRYYIKLGLNALLRGDIDARREFYRLLLDRGVFSINEVRELEDMNKVEGGDLRMLQSSMIPLSMIEGHYNKMNENGNAEI